MDQVRIGIIGCGVIAGEHAGHYVRNPDARIVALCDIVPGKAEEFREKHKLPDDVACYRSAEEMFAAETLDAVSICTYNRQHAPAAISALRHGVDVLLEKPFAATVEEAVDIMRAEKESGRFVSVGFQPRFNADMQNIKKICESGTLGKIYYIQTGGGRRQGLPTTESFVRRDQAGIGAMGDIGCYSLDMVLNAIGYPRPLTVSGYSSDFFGRDPGYRFHEAFDVEDFAAAFIRLEGGCVLDFRISWAMHPDSPGDTVIFGTEGALRVPATDCWNEGPGGEMTLYYNDENGEPAEKKIPAVKGGEPDCFKTKIGQFVQAVKNGGPAPVPTSQILINQVIINAILESARLGREIECVVPEI